MLLGVADVLTAEILTQALIRVTGINKHDVSILFMGLTHHTVDKETLSTARRSKDKEVAVVGKLLLAFLTTDVYSYRYPWRSV